MNKELAWQSWACEKNKRRDNKNVPHARHEAALTIGKLVLEKAGAIASGT